MRELTALVNQLGDRGKWDVGDTPYLIRALAKYPSKVKALKEYVANSLDAATEIDQTSLSISVILDPHSRNIIIHDTGPGIPESTLAALPENIAKSHKRDVRGLRRLIGHKAWGMLAFGTLGDDAKAVIVSKTSADRNYNALYMRIPRTERDLPRFGSIDPELIPGPKFDLNHGTTVAITDVDANSFRTVLTPSNLRKELGRIFEPRLLRSKGNVKIYVGQYSNGEQTPLVYPVELPNYQCFVPIDSVNCELTHLLTGNGSPKAFVIPPEDGGGHIEALFSFNLFVDPTAAAPRVRLHNEGVEVCQLSLVERIKEHKPFVDPHLTGFVDVT